MSAIESNDRIPSLVGGRRVPRPRFVQVCAGCGELLGAGYAECDQCHDAIENIWLADWRALLHREQVTAGSPDEKLLAEIVIAEFGKHPWTEMDIAMSHLRCGQCGGELGESYRDCAECGMAFGSSIQSEFHATGNEHALHIGRWVLRFPHRHSKNAVIAWRMSMPRLLTGWLPTTEGANRVMALIKRGQLEEAEQLAKQVDLAINSQGAVNATCFD